MKLATSFVQEFVIGFGFLSGLWIHVGVDPETEIVKAFASAIQQIAPGFSVVFWLIPIATSIVAWFSSYLIGGWIGVLSVALALLGGIFISSPVGIWLLIGGIVLGFLAPHMKTD